MKNAETIGGRFVFKEYITDAAKKLLDDLDAREKTAKKAGKKPAAV
jgi:pyruvate ferredoxin oxidoreductase beta subunit